MAPNTSGWQEETLSLSRSDKATAPRPWRALGQVQVEPRGAWVPKGEPLPTQMLGFRETKARGRGRAASATLCP